VLHVFEDGERVRNGLVVFVALDVGNETYAAGISFELGGVKTSLTHNRLIVRVVLSGQVMAWKAFLPVGDLQRELQVCGGGLFCKNNDWRVFRWKQDYKVTHYFYFTVSIKIVFQNKIEKFRSFSNP
jgi:hypothetical protein